VQAPVGRGKNAAQQAMAQVETLRKMLLAMASDMRVVLVRLASCVTTLRYFAEKKRFDEVTAQLRREVLDLYAPLANRLGIWQLKWELEDLSFRLIEPETYKRIAKMLEEKRMLRESFVASSIERLQCGTGAAGIKAEVSGRPKHIYSIWNKMRGKELDFTELYDVRAFRVIVPMSRPATRCWAWSTISGPRSRRNSTTTSRARSRTATSRCTRW
jgi:GTP pyrophosphokinase